MKKYVTIESKVLKKVLEDYDVFEIMEEKAKESPDINFTQRKTLQILMKGIKKRRKIITKALDD